MALEQLTPAPQGRTVINDPNAPGFDPNKFTVEVMADGSERIISVNNVDPALFIIQPLGGAAQDAMPQMEQDRPDMMGAPPPAPPQEPTPQPLPAIPVATPTPAGPEPVMPAEASPVDQSASPLIPPTAQALAPPMPTIAAGAIAPSPPPTSPPPRAKTVKRKQGRPVRREPAYTLGHGPRL